MDPLVVPSEADADLAQPQREHQILLDWALATNTIDNIKTLIKQGNPLSLKMIARAKEIGTPDFIKISSDCFSQALTFFYLPFIEWIMADQRNNEGFADYFLRAHYDDVLRDGRTDILEFLLANNFFRPNDIILVQKPESTKRYLTFLMIACREGYLDAVIVLLKYGADPLIEERRAKLNSFFYACTSMYSPPEIFHRLFLACGDVTAINKERQNLLQWAMLLDVRKGVIDAILSYGQIDPNSALQFVIDYCDRFIWFGNHVKAICKNMKYLLRDEKIDINITVRGLSFTDVLYFKCRPMMCEKLIPLVFANPALVLNFRSTKYGHHLERKNFPYHELAPTFRTRLELDSGPNGQAGNVGLLRQLLTKIGD